jgi:hypothetical protein
MRDLNGGGDMYEIPKFSETCPHHGHTMFFGVAIVNLATGISDFGGQSNVVTMSLDPTKFKLIRIAKCCVCGHSVSIGEKE